MRRPAQHRLGPTPAPGWAHPYTGTLGLAVFYNDGGDPVEPPTPTPGNTPKPAPPAADPAKQFTQDDLDRIAAREKAQGKRSALKEFAEAHGFNSVEDAEAFIAAARQAEDAKKTEDQKRQEALERREQELAAREAAAAARERTAIRTAALARLGATGTDLEDALALLEHDLRGTPDADEATVQAAAEALKERRKGLFGAVEPAPQPGQMPPAPGGAPAGGIPHRQAPTGRPGDRGREMARLRGHKRDAA